MNLLRIVARIRALPHRYNWRGLSCGKGSLFDGTVQLRQFRTNVQAGSQVRFGRRITFDVADGGCVRLGSRVNLTQDIIIAAKAEVVIGSGTLIAEYCSIRDSEHVIGSERIDSSIDRSAPVLIGSGVWIGRGTYIGPGVKIGDDAVVGANSVVREDVPSRAVVAGSPARILRTRD